VLDLAAHLGLVDWQVVIALDKKLGEFVGAGQAAGVGRENSVLAGLHRFLNFLDWSLPAAANSQSGALIEEGRGVSPIEDQ